MCKCSELELCKIYTWLTYNNIIYAFVHEILHILFLYKHCVFSTRGQPIALHTNLPFATQ